MAVYVVGLSIVSWMRALELQTSTWDMGIYQQALWSATHGPPFFETPDLETGGFGSFLQVHSTFSLYLLVPVYGLLPGQPVLLVTQAVVVGLAAIPLSKYASAVLGTPTAGLAVALVYLASAPILSGNLYDFHAEAFLPLEYFSFLYFWQVGRYRWGLVAVLASFLTFEIMPIVIFFTGIFFLLPDRSAIGRAWAGFRSPGDPGRLRWLLGRLSKASHDRGIRAHLALLPIGVLGYEALLGAREYLVAPLLGVAPFPTGASATGYIIGTTPSDLGLSLSNLPMGFSTKVLGWFLVLALLGFVPLLAPRAYVLSLPWLSFSFLSQNLNYVLPGFQYGFIEALGLLPAFVLGLIPLRGVADRLRRVWAARRARRPAASSDDGSARPIAGSGRLSALAGLLLVSLLAVNLAASPLDPALQNVGLGSAYRVSYVVPAGHAEVERLVALLPREAPVIASDTLFPLVANDENAYSFSWIADPYLILPYDASHLPPYVLIAEDRLGAVPDWVASRLYDSAAYGLLGVVGDTVLGVVYLFEAGYRGPVEELSPVALPPTTYFGKALGAGPSATIVPNPSGRFPEAIQGVPGDLGNLWNGPGVDAPSGSYRIVLHLSESAYRIAPPPTASMPVVRVNGNAFGSPEWFARNLTWGELAGPGDVPVSFSVNLSAPVSWIYLRGYALSPNVTITIDYLEIERI